MSMIHYLHVGHLDPEAIRRSSAVATRPLEAGVVARLLADFPGLEVEQRGGYVVLPWHGLGQADRAEEFALRLMRATGSIAADRRNGRLIEASQLKGLARKQAAG
jgi:hypothetical protein